MKKIFIVAMALAAFVSCSKDDGVDKVLTSKEKSVSVTIQNSIISGTRAVVKGSDASFTPEAIGGEAGLTDQVGTKGEDGETETLVADLGTLQILFANQAGQVLHAMPLVNEADDDIHAGENGTNENNEPNEYVPGTSSGNPVSAEGGVYTFHRVPEAVTRIAVIRDTEVLAGQTLEGQTLASIQAWALKENEALNLDVQNIFLYAEGDLAQSNECYEDEVNGVTTKYYFYTTTLNIEPQYTRFELVSVSCDDLGTLNTDKKDGKDDISTVGLDHLQLVKFTIPLKGQKYTKTWTVTDKNNWTLYGDACSTETCGKAKKTAITADEEQGAAGYAWSWNMAPGKLNLAAAPMVLDLNADSHHMFVNNKAKTVKVVSLNQNPEFEFKKGEVYRMALSFSESNIDKTDDQLCVKATVKIANWKVVLVTPEFATKPNN